MKKILLVITTLCMALSLSAQKIGYYVRVDSPELESGQAGGYPDETAGDVKQQPEKNAYNWFKTEYVEKGTGAFLTIENIKAGISIADYPVLWINVDYVGAPNIEDARFDDDAKAAIKTYVEQGGQLFLTKQACVLAQRIERINYEPTFNSGGYNKGEDTWCIKPNLGAGLSRSYNRINHPIYKDIEPADDGNIPLVNDVQRTDNNMLWSDLKRIDGGKDGNDNPLNIESFEHEWQCQMLATWPHINDYCNAGIIDFLPNSRYRGSVIVCGFAAYQWGSSNGKIANVQKLTSNALDLLWTRSQKEPNPTSAVNAKLGYLLIENNIASLPAEGYNNLDQQPERNAADWFKTNYVEEGKGRFVYLHDLDLTGINELWINIDRISFTSLQDLGFTDDIINQLKTFVQNGGNLLATKQATELVYRIDRINYAPMDGKSMGEKLRRYHDVGQGDDWNVNPYPTDVDNNANRMDQRNHPLFAGLEMADDHRFKMLRGACDYSNTEWEWIEFWDKNRTKNPDNNRSSDLLLNHQNTWNDKVLAICGHINDYCYPCIIEFLPQDGWKGSIIAIGYAGYQWGTSVINNNTYNAVLTMTENALEYLRPVLKLDETATETPWEQGSAIDVELTRTLVSTDYNTFCVPFAVTSDEMVTYFGDNCELFEFVATQTNGDELTLYFNKTYAIEAGVPYIIRPAAEVVNPSFPSRVLSSTTPSSVTKDNVSFIGVYTQTQMNKSDIQWILGSGATVYHPIDGTSMKGLRAYFETSIPAKTIRASFHQTPTELERKPIAPKEGKFLRDNQLIIKHQGEEYTIEGKKIAQ